MKSLEEQAGPGEAARKGEILAAVSFLPTACLFPHYSSLTNKPFFPEDGGQHVALLGARSDLCPLLVSVHRGTLPRHREQSGSRCLHGFWRTHAREPLAGGGRESLALLSGDNCYQAVHRTPSSHSGGGPYLWGGPGKDPVTQKFF